MFKSFTKHALVSAAVVTGVSADCWEVHPTVGMLRTVWKDCQPGASESNAPPRPTMALALHPTAAPAATGAAGGARLSVADRDRLRRDLEAKCPSVLLTPSSLPAMSYLQFVQSQVSQKAWEWVPWKKMRSDKAANAVRERKTDRVSHGRLGCAGRAVGSGFVTISIQSSGFAVCAGPCVRNVWSLPLGQLEPLHL